MNTCLTSICQSIKDQTVYQLLLSTVFHSCAVCSTTCVNRGACHVIHEAFSK